MLRYIITWIRYPTTSIFIFLYVRNFNLKASTYDKGQNIEIIGYRVYQHLDNVCVCVALLLSNFLLDFDIYNIIYAISQIARIKIWKS